MDLQALVDEAKEALPALKGLPNEKALALLRYAFRKVGQQLIVTAEGVVEFQALGSFQVKQVEREKDGQKVTRKRVTFKAAKPKGKGKRKGEQQAAEDATSAT